jgi:hypothetical protein
MGILRFTPKAEEVPAPLQITDEPVSVANAVTEELAKGEVQPTAEPGEMGQRLDDKPQDNDPATGSDQFKIGNSSVVYDEIAGTLRLQPLDETSAGTLDKRKSWNAIIRQRGAGAGTGADILVTVTAVTRPGAGDATNAKSDPDQEAKASKAEDELRSALDSNSDSENGPPVPEGGGA